jgi:hypothetical protein
VKRRIAALLAIGGLIMLSIPADGLHAAGPPHQLGAAAGASFSGLEARAILDKYCVTCHNSRLKTAGLLLDSVDVGHVAARADVWEKVRLKLLAGEMPPAGRSRPDKQAYDGLTSWLETELDRAGVANPNPGRPDAFRRLNRAEYRRVIRDLLALSVEDKKIADLLPADDESYGFDNTAGVRMSPTLMEQYLNAAEKISRLAVGASAPVLSGDTFQVPENLSQNDWLDGLPFGTRGGTVIKYNFPADGTYEISVRLGRYNFAGGGRVPNYDVPQRLEIRLDGERLHVFTQPVVPRDEQPQTDSVRAPSQPVPSPSPKPDRFKDVDEDWQFRFAAKAGPRTITLAWLNRTPELLEHLRYTLRPYPGYSDPGGGGSGVDSYYRNRTGAYLNTAEIRGPFDARGPGDTPSRRRIFACHPTRPAEEASCAKTIFSTLARRAYRRSVTDADLQPLLTFYEDGRLAGGFEAGIEHALQALLTSWEFLYRVERDPANVAPNTNYRLSDEDLASRLSFFLWSSIPDDELLDLVHQGTLSSPGVLEQQVRRMVADPRSEALVDGFVSQWLYLRNVAGVSPDPRVDPDFDDGLRQAFRKETELFVRSIIREDRSVLDLLTADYTFVNERLARHYGILNVHGDHFRRVTLTDSRRHGLLGQGSILSVTSYPHRTSPVLRGKWVLENLLGTPPPAPPPNVPDLDSSQKSTNNPTLRERMSLHRTNPVCSSCHARMDPIGFAMEAFDLDGRLRVYEGDSRTAIDTSGILPSGEKFDGIVGLRQALVNHADQVVETMTKKLLTYALGRGVDAYDMPAVRAVRRDAARADYRFSSIILGVVRSLPFQMRRAAGA